MPCLAAENGSRQRARICAMNKVFVSGAAAMAVVLMASNYLVQFPLGEWLTWAAFTYPLAFLVTDCVNRAANAAMAAKVVLFGFLFGVPLSFAFIISAPGDADWLVAARIAGASGFAFAVAQSADIAVFDRLRRLAWWVPPVVSSAPASALDTVIFFSSAFAGTDVPWITLALGDFAVKALMVLLLLPPYRLFIGGLRAAA